MSTAWAVLNSLFLRGWSLGRNNGLTIRMPVTNSMATGRSAAANQANVHVKAKTIDKTSELYQKSMELENYFVKQMLSEMRKTIHHSNDSDFARQTYEDMLYDEYATAMTKNAGFGLADQIYLSLA